MHSVKFQNVKLFLFKTLLKSSPFKLLLNFLLISLSILKAAYKLYKYSKYQFIWEYLCEHTKIWVIFSVYTSHSKTNLISLHNIAKSLLQKYKKKIPEKYFISFISYNLVKMGIKNSVSYSILWKSSIYLLFYNILFIITFHFQIQHECLIKYLTNSKISKK